jgi:hypothetical protein
MTNVLSLIGREPGDPLLLGKRGSSLTVPRVCFRGSKSPRFMLSGSHQKLLRGRNRAASSWRPEGDSALLRQGYSWPNGGAVMDRCSTERQRRGRHGPTTGRSRLSSGSNTSFVCKCQRCPLCGHRHGSKAPLLATGGRHCPSSPGFRPPTAVRSDGAGRRHQPDGRGQMGGRACAAYKRRLEQGATVERLIPADLAAARGDFGVAGYRGGRDATKALTQAPRDGQALRRPQIARRAAPRDGRLGEETRGIRQGLRDAPFLVRGR